VKRRREVVDHATSTSTGITATIPATIALVEAIAGRAKARELAEELGVSHWDARHDSSAFRLTNEHRKTFVRNWIAFWRRETLGVPVSEGVDEIALGLTVDAWSRTASGTAITIAAGETVRTRHGLRIHPAARRQAAVDRMLPSPSADTPARALDRALADIEARYGRPTAEIVALSMEYPWSGEIPPLAMVELR